ncbi:MAG: hypothetical protein ACYTGG_07235 [Planctomycetota bacterium]|jgi:hypothetical protein
MLVIACSVVVARPAAAAEVQLSYDQPTLDRWMYVFNATAGFRTTAAVFGSVEISEFDEFDDRDGQVLLGYDTTLFVPPDLPRGQYDVLAATVTVMVESVDTFVYDPTYDSYRSLLDPDDPDYLPDSDAGRPVIISGAGYRNQFEDEPFPENGPFDNVPDPARRTRNVYPITFDAFGDPVDISNNVFDRFEAQPWAVGQIPGLVAGSVVANRTEMELTIDVSDPLVQCYLRSALQAGRLDLVVSSLHFADPFGGTTYPVFYTRENLAVPTTASAARLEVTVVVPDGPVTTGDVNADGVVDIVDLLALLSAWGACDCCPEDLNEDGVVDIVDLLALLANWS